MDELMRQTAECIHELKTKECNMNRKYPDQYTKSASKYIEQTVRVLSLPHHIDLAVHIKIDQAIKVSTK